MRSRHNIISLLIIYIVTNLLGQGITKINPIILLIGNVLDFVLHAGMVFTFLRVIAEMKGKSLGRRLTRIYMGIIVLLAGAYGAGIAVFFISGNIKPIQALTASIFILSLAVFIVSLIGLIRYRPAPAAPPPFRFSSLWLVLSDRIPPLHNRAPFAR